MTAEGRSLLRGLSLFSAHLDFMPSFRCLKQPTFSFHHCDACKRVYTVAICTPGSTSCLLNIVEIGVCLQQAVRAVTVSLSRVCDSLGDRVDYRLSNFSS